MPCSSFSLVVYCNLTLFFSFSSKTLKNYERFLWNLSPLDYGLGGDEEIRTLDPLRARQVLSQLSYTPIKQSPKWKELMFSLERRWSSRTFRYGYLVTTSPQSLTLPSTAASKMVSSQASGIAYSHGVTGGVYKTRERIHRSILICDY